MDQPLVSIVIPCYNGEKNLMECLESLFAQTYENCEIIVIDDGSSDGSLEMLKSVGDRIRYETGPNRGACAARNQGLDLATGEFVKFFDADDVMMPDAIAAQVEGMKNLASNQFVYGNLLDLDTREAVFDDIRTTEKTTRDEMVYMAFCRDIITGAPLHRRQFLIDHELRFDTRFLDGQEWDLHLSIALAGGIFIYQPVVIYHYRSHDDPDRISEVLKDPALQMREKWIRFSSSGQKIINAYRGHQIPLNTKNKLRRRLCKAEARFASGKMSDKASDMRKIRSQLDPWWRIILDDIRYIPRRYFSKRR